MDSLSSNTTIDNNVLIDSLKDITIGDSCKKSHNISSAIPFPKDGIRLSSIDIFYNACGGRDKLIGLTTTDVNEKFLKPITESNQLSYCELLKSQDNDCIAKASVFISHAWKYEFLHVIDALIYHLRDAPDTIIWFDLFSNNQHRATELDFNWWCNTFKSAIRDFGRTVMVLAPWSDPVPLTRGWCLFEVYCTIITNSKFEVAMSKVHREEFLKDISSDAQKSINMMLASIDAFKCQCFKEEDRAMIFEIVRQEVGFDKVNSMIFECIRKWMIETTDAAYKEEIDEIMQLSLMHALAEVYRLQGKYDSSEPLFIECLKLRKQRLGVDHPDTLKSMNNLALLYLDRGIYNLSEPLYIECLEHGKQKLGVDHPLTLLFMNNLALLYSQQGKFDLSEPIYIDCLEKKKQKLGVEHEDTLLSMHNLGSLYERQGKYELTEPIYIDCLEKRKQKLGIDHPDTLMSMNNLASLYFREGKYQLVEPLYIECLEKRKEKLGVDDPYTLMSVNNLAYLYMHQEKFELAQPLLIDCLEKRKQKLGIDNLYTLMSMGNLATLYDKQGKYELAQSLLIEGQEKCKENLGVDNPLTQEFISHLAKVRARGGDGDSLY